MSARPFYKRPFVYIVLALAGMVMVSLYAFLAAAISPWEAPERPAASTVSALLDGVAAGDLDMQYALLEIDSSGKYEQALEECDPAPKRLEEFCERLEVLAALDWIQNSRSAPPPPPPLLLGPPTEAQ